MPLDYTKAGNFRPPVIQSRVPSQTYKDNYDKIFNKDKPDVPVFCRHCRELQNKCLCGNFEGDTNTK